MKASQNGRHEHAKYTKSGISGYNRQFIYSVYHRLSSLKGEIFMFYYVRGYWSLSVIVGKSKLHLYFSQLYASRVYFRHTGHRVEGVLRHVRVFFHFCHVHTCTQMHSCLRYSLPDSHSVYIYFSEAVHIITAGCSYMYMYPHTYMYLLIVSTAHRLVWIPIIAHKFDSMLLASSVIKEKKLSPSEINTE